jgi:hypothetical protein
MMRRPKAWPGWPDWGIVEATHLLVVLVCITLVGGDLFFDKGQLGAVNVSRYDTFVQLLAGIAFAGTIYEGLRKNRHLEILRDLDEHRNRLKAASDEVEKLIARLNLDDPAWFGCPAGLNESYQRAREVRRLHRRCRLSLIVTPFAHLRVLAIATRFKMTSEYLAEKDPAWFGLSGMTLAAFLLASASAESVSVSAFYPLCCIIICFAPFARHIWLYRISLATSELDSFRASMLMAQDEDRLSQLEAWRSDLEHLANAWHGMPCPQQHEPGSPGTDLRAHLPAQLNAPH